MRTGAFRRLGFAWLEVLVALALLALSVQFFPSLFKQLFRLADIRQWPTYLWIVINGIIILALTCIRFGPNLSNFSRRKLTAKSSFTDRKAAESSGKAFDNEFESRIRRDAEWRDRARKRLPWQ
jgi:hypothetical protein